MIHGYADTANTRRDQEVCTSEKEEYLLARIDALTRELDKHRKIKDVNIQLVNNKGVVYSEYKANCVIVRVQNNEILDIQIFEE